MSGYHLPGDPPVPVTIRRSAQARRISLRISSLDGRVTLTLPASLSEAEGLDFVEEKADWVREHLAKHPAQVQVGIGTILPLEGRQVRVSAGAGRRVVLTLDDIAVPGKNPGATLQRYLKELARDRLAEASDHYAKRLGKPYTRLSLRDTRSRWGSCSSKGVLMYSWRLLMAPPDVLRYVAAHEVSHLAEMNHSAAFWQTVEGLYGDYTRPRHWLRENGGALHRYRFAT